MNSLLFGFLFCCLFVFCCLHKFFHMFNLIHARHSKKPFAGSAKDRENWGMVKNRRHRKSMGTLPLAARCRILPSQCKLAFFKKSYIGDWIWFWDGIVLMLGAIWCDGNKNCDEAKPKSQEDATPPCTTRSPNPPKKGLFFLCIIYLEK